MRIVVFLLSYNSNRTSSFVSNLGKNNYRTHESVQWKWSSISYTCLWLVSNIQRWKWGFWQWSNGWAATKCSKSRNNCKVHEVVARDCQITLKFMEDQVHITKNYWNQIFMKIWKTREVCEVCSTQSHGRARGAQCHNLWRFHQDLSAKSTLPQLHCYCKQVLGISVRSWNNISNHGVQNRIITETQKNLSMQKLRMKWMLILSILDSQGEPKIEHEGKTVNSGNYACRCWKSYSRTTAGSFCMTIPLPILP